MKTKIVGVLVCTLLIAAAVLPVAGTIIEKESPTSFKLGGNSLNYQNTPRSIMSNIYSGIFIQLPYLANASTSQWGAPISDPDYEGGYIVYEDFWDISEPICDIHWWGLAGETGSIPGDPTGMVFNITFYEDDGAGKPGNVVCEYVDIAPTIIRTGTEYHSESGNTWPLYYFTDVTLEPCCEISEGWVSIQSQSYLEIGVMFGWEPSPDGNNNAWQYWCADQTWVQQWDDLAVVLTDGEPAEPDLDCDGELSWSDVEPGTIVTGSFEVRNNGDPTSILNWNTSSYPNWGVNWTFAPKASVLTPEMDWITVEVEVIAPEEGNTEFEGEIVLVNVEDPDDTCTIPVTLVTPCESPFLQLLEFLMQRFPILGHILHHLFV